uniref:Transmembrane protein n=1 Tax=Romanomermis culicivorax TaxID=13658 RepID=A0A915I4E7_ROMCU
MNNTQRKREKKKNITFNTENRILLGSHSNKVGSCQISPPAVRTYRFGACCCGPFDVPACAAFGVAAAAVFFIISGNGSDEVLVTDDVKAGLKSKNE